MEQFNPDLLKQLYIPPADSHKGQNGKLMIIGGSHLFHASALWPLEIASKIVDMVFYSSVIENNTIVQKLKEEFRNGIIVPRESLEDYIKEADCVLIGPGMVRTDAEKGNVRGESLSEINKIQDEGLQTYFLTKYLLKKYPEKKWVIDAGALQMLDPEWLLPLKGNVVLTPHPKEFQRAFNSVITGDEGIDEANALTLCGDMAQKYNCTILLKGKKDVLCSPDKCIEVAGGNAGMTRGGTGDVLAGLVGALACNNDLWLAATAGSYINKRAGDSLFEKVGYYFNASDLADEIPMVMKDLLL